jgi:glutamate/tyrosine decarboxylase-like PLP-dependent enzyme
LYSLIAQHSGFEAASEPPMSAICIRYSAGNLDEAASKRLHAEVVAHVEKSGKFWISTTELKGKTWFRINPVNFRTRTEHMEQLLALLEKECRTAASNH